MAALPRQNRFFEDFLHFTKHVLLYKKPARPVSLPYCTLKAFQTVFEYCPCPPALSGVLRPFAGLKQGLDNRKKVFLVEGMQSPNIKFQP